MFSKVLIANRGIIRELCIQAVKELGAKAAVFYVSDKESGVGEVMADEAYEFPSSHQVNPFYDGQRIVELAERIGADAVHPGYGFLSANLDFAEKLAARGIRLIGPDPARVLPEFFRKPDLKRVAQKLRIPVLASSKACSSLAQVEEAAREIGYPLVLKPVSGSGARAVAHVLNEAQLRPAYDASLSRILRYEQGAEEVFLEQYCSHARHLEFPVIRDAVGNVVVLPEIECSVQRKFQKLLIETPSCFEDKALLKTLATKSRRLVERLEFVGVASVEFLISGDEAYFLEINGYLQPGFAASSRLNGIDIVREQISICAGESLSFSQEDVFPRGCAVSLSINAEDPLEDFTPSPGTVDCLAFPSASGVELLTTVSSGDEISSLYAPVIGQAIAVDQTREAAICKLQAALSSCIIEGLKTNLPFLEALLGAPEFAQGKIDMDYLSDAGKLQELAASMQVSEEEDMAAFIAALTLHNDANSEQIIQAAENRAQQYSFWNLTSRLLNRNKMEF